MLDESRMIVVFENVDRFDVLPAILMIPCVEYRLHAIMLNLKHRAPWHLHVHFCLTLVEVGIIIDGIIGNVTSFVKDVTIYRPYESRTVHSFALFLYSNNRYVRTLSPRFV